MYLLVHSSKFPDVHVKLSGNFIISYGDTSARVNIQNIIAQIIDITDDIRPIVGIVQAALTTFLTKVDVISFTIDENFTKIVQGVCASLMLFGYSCA